jgi:hypothetical protein
MTAAINAGAVAIEIHGKDANFMATLNRIEKGITGKTAKLRNFFVGFAAGGQVIRSVIAPIAGLATEFARAGDGIAKMSKRVGIGAKDLSLLGFAAEQSGASAADLGNSMKFLKLHLAEAGRGNMSITAGLNRRLRQPNDSIAPTGRYSFDSVTPRWGL